MVDETKKKRLNTVEDRTPGSANYSGFLQSGTKANAPGGKPELSKKEKIMKQFQKILESGPSTLPFPIAGLSTAMKAARQFKDPEIKNLIERVKDKFGKKDGGAVRKGDSEAVQMYHAGGEVKKKKSKVAGRLAQRGYGKARK